MNSDSSSSNDSTEERTPSQSTSSLIPRILSGSIGSIVTALAVTPLEVVKIRQQLSGADTATSGTQHLHQTSIEKASIPQPCPRGCTVVLNNGLMECVVPKSSVCDAIPFTRSFNHARQAFTPRYSGGTLHTLMSIVHYEGVAGLYAGLRPTLVMSVPNTVLYFTVYDEISLLLRKKVVNKEKSNQSNFALDQSKTQTCIPLIAGATARLLASLTTAPLELIRTRQASIVMEKGASLPGMIQEFRHLLKTNGMSSLYVGLAPTLWRDVPFSAIYWMCLEKFKNELSGSKSLGKWGGKHYQETGETIPAFVGAIHAFISGAAAGSIAAAFTTPFDVVKTRRQMVTQGTYGINERNRGILGHMQQIMKQEGVSGLWKGNTTRMVKVAPACAIMISVYEFGKVSFGEVM